MVDDFANRKVRKIHLLTEVSITYINLMLVTLSIYKA